MLENVQIKFFFFIEIFSNIENFQRLKFFQFFNVFFSKRLRYTIKAVTGKKLGEGGLTFF